ncbi:MAG: hypothetical protein RMM58_01480 [Chloroflexota bacterium]|nr:hypothetical protein [Dehalococcoidia bacterium]MDW8252530.1 hypothetical protein [Chloroflexota bacterium]
MREISQVVHVGGTTIPVELSALGVKAAAGGGLTVACFAFVAERRSWEMGSLGAR